MGCDSLVWEIGLLEVVLVVFFGQIPDSVQVVGEVLWKVVDDDDVVVVVAVLGFQELCFEFLKYLICWDHSKFDNSLLPCGVLENLFGSHSCRMESGDLSSVHWDSLPGPLDC